MLFVAVFCLRDSAGAVAQFKGFPSKQRLVITAVTNAPSKPAAQLPPPIAPGMDRRESVTASEKLSSSIEIEKHPSPAGIEIEKHAAPAFTITAPKIESTPEPDADAERKARIKADRERLNRNAVVWQQERAAGGSATAQRSLAMRYFSGDGLPKDEIKGMDLLRKAAAGGDSAAQKELAKREPAKKE
jgi:hypothetical protein